MKDEKEKEIHDLKKEIIYLNCLFELSNESANLALKTNRELREYIKKKKI